MKPELQLTAANKKQWIKKLLAKIANKYPKIQEPILQDFKK